MCNKCGGNFDGNSRDCLLSRSEPFAFFRSRSPSSCSTEPRCRRVSQRKAPHFRGDRQTQPLTLLTRSQPPNASLSIRQCMSYSRKSRATLPPFSRVLYAYLSRLYPIPPSTAACILSQSACLLHPPCCSKSLSAPFLVFRIFADLHGLWYKV